MLENTKQIITKQSNKHKSRLANLNSKLLQSQSSSDNETPKKNRKVIKSSFGFCPIPLMQCTDSKSFHDRSRIDNLKNNSESSSLLKPIYNGKGSDLICQLNANCNTITIDEDKIGSRKTRYEIHPNGFVPSTSHHQNMIHFSSIKRNTKAAMNFEKNNKSMKESTKFKISRNLSIFSKNKIDKNYYENEMKRLNLVFNNNDVAKPYMNKLLAILRSQSPEF